LGYITKLVAPLYEGEFCGKPRHSHFLLLSDCCSFPGCLLWPAVAACHPFDLRVCWPNTAALYSANRLPLN
jgi:hypothetical protein